MSPALLSHARARRSRTPRFAVAALATLGALALSAPAAHATVTKMSFTDPAGDAGGNDSADLIAGTVTYDSTAGTIVAAITTKALNTSGANGSAIAVALGHTTSTGCSTQDQDGTDVALLYGYSPSTPELSIWTTLGTNDTNNNTISHSGNTLTLATNDPDGLLKGKTFSCFMALTQSPGATSDDNDPNADSATGLVVGSGGSTTTTPGGSQQSNTITTAPVTTTDADADHDGTPDSADKCPTVPGAQADGCPTMPAALEIRLGAKRVVIDRLVQRTTASTCPKGVRVHVTTKGKLIGNTVIPTSQFGSFCRVSGVIKIKKTVKAVRVTMKSTGLASIAKSARR